MKVGYVKDKTKRFKEQMVNHPDATKNLAGGLAFDIPDASVKLLTMIGGSFFNEPKYYGGNLSREGKSLLVNELASKGVVKYHAAELEDQAKEIVETAIAIANSEAPRDLLALANWCRSEMNIRSTPQVLLAIAANNTNTKEWVREYCSKVIKRPDEIRDVVAIYTWLFGRPFPNSLKKGICDALKKVNEYGFMKYNTDIFPTFKDVLLLTTGAKKRSPLSKEVYTYLVNGEITDESKTPVFAARNKV